MRDSYPLGRYDLPAPWLKETSVAEAVRMTSLNAASMDAFARVELMHRYCEEIGECGSKSANRYFRATKIGD